VIATVVLAAIVAVWLLFRSHAPPAPPGFVAKNWGAAWSSVAARRRAHARKLVFDGIKKANWLFVQGGLELWADGKPSQIYRSEAGQWSVVFTTTHAFVELRVLNDASGSFDYPPDERRSLQFPR
jgi:hypothetical protein